MGTMCTRNQRRARTKSSPEQKVNRKAGGRGRPASDLAALTFTGSYRLDRTGRLPPLRIFTRAIFGFAFPSPCTSLPLEPLSLHLPQYDKSCVAAYTNYLFD